MESHESDVHVQSSLTRQILQIEESKEIPKGLQRGVFMISKNLVSKVQEEVVEPFTPQKADESSEDLSQDENEEEKKDENQPARQV